MLPRQSDKHVANRTFWKILVFSSQNIFSLRQQREREIIMNLFGVREPTITILYVSSRGSFCADNKSIH